jgi:Phage integrase, N-terminal SAM-like domain
VGRLRLGEVGFAAGRETLDEYVTGTWAHAHGRHLAPKTRAVYGGLYDLHIGPRLGDVPLSQISPELVARFQADLIGAGVGPEARRKSVVLLGGILQRATEGRRIA